MPVLTKLVTDRAVTGPLRQEAMTALATLIDPRGMDLLLDLVSDPVPSVRGSAFTALARLESSTFLSVLAGLEADADWNVRVAVATALGSLPGEQGVPRLTVMLQDRDNRVIPAVLNALVASKAQGLEKVLLERLKSDDFVVRAAAANGLAEIKAPGAAQALTEAYKRVSGRRRDLRGAWRGARRAGEAGSGRCPTGTRGRTERSRLGSPCSCAPAAGGAGRHRAWTIKCGRQLRAGPSIVPTGRRSSRPSSLRGRSSIRTRAPWNSSSLCSMRR